MTNPRDPSYLISGHATETLSAAERRRLYSAALEDQEVFDRLVGEERWRQVLSSPGVRQELLEVLARPAPGLLGGVFGWLKGLPTLALGATAAALLAVALVPRWLDFGVPGPVPGEGPPRVAAPPTELVAKGYEPQSGTAGEEAGSELVAKSYGGPAVAPEAPAPPLESTGSTRGLRSKSIGSSRSLQPKSTGSGYLNLSYTLELNQPGGPRPVADGWVFDPGDQFRLRLGVDFSAWLYLFNRAAGDADYVVLYPHTAAESDPLPPSEHDVVLPAGVWLTMDDSPEDEELVLVASTRPWPPAAGREAIPAGELDAALERAETDFAALNWRRSELDERVRLTVQESDALVLVLRLLGR